ncbi:MAG TPA: hypothetical protein VIE13_09765 [Terriglobales bacterium]|jgi:hypothetical protein
MAIDPFGLDSIFCMPHVLRGDGPLHDKSAEANGEFGPYDPGSGDGIGLGGSGGCPVSLDGVTLDFSLGDALSGGGFSGGGSAGSEITVTPDGAGEPGTIVPNPNGQGVC